MSVYEGFRRTGIEWMDREHATICRMFNTVRQFARAKNWRQAKSCHKALVKSVQQHFRYEEELMRLYAYPDTEYHIRAHREFLDELVLLYARLSASAHTADIDGLLHRTKMFGQSLAENDLDVVRHLRENGYR